MNKRIVFFIASVILYLFIDWYQWDIILIITNMSNSLVSGIFFYIMLFIRFSLLLLMIIIAITYAQNNKKTMIFTLLIILTLFLFQFFLPLTDVYIDMNYKINSQDRQTVVAMLHGNEEMRLTQSNMYTYILPKDLRTTSHNAKITIEEGERSFSVLFYVHKGLFKSSAIVYSSDNLIKESMFGLTIEKSKQLDICWYSVVFK